MSDPAADLLATLNAQGIAVSTAVLVVDDLKVMLQALEPVTPIPPTPLTGITYAGAIQLPGGIKFGKHAQFIDGFTKDGVRLHAVGSSTTVYQLDQLDGFSVKTLAPCPVPIDGASVGWSTIYGGLMVINAGRKRGMMNGTDWRDIGPADPLFPAYTLSNAFYPQTGSSNVRMVSGVGVSAILTQDAFDGVNFRHYGPIAGYQFQGDPALFQQFWDSATGTPTKVGSPRKESDGQCLSFDWKTGAIVSTYLVYGQFTPYSVVLAQVPPLSAPTDPFVMSWDASRRKLVLFHVNHVWVVDYDAGKVSDCGSIPIPTTGFYSGFYETETDSHLLTGEAGGTDKFHQFQLPPVPVNPTLPVDVWYEGDVTQIYCNFGMRWQNPGGDWWSADGIAQGSVAYDFKSISAAGLYTFNVLALLQWWLLNQNTGVCIRNDGSDASFAGRVYSDPTKRPVLTVVTPSGTYVCPCIESTVCIGGIGTSGPGAVDHFSPNGVSGLLRFDLSPIVGVPTAATLALTCITYYAPTRTARIYRPRSPKVVDIDNMGPVVQGFAAGYPADGTGMLTRPGVLAVSDASPGWGVRALGLTPVQAALVEANPSFSDVVADPDFGSKAIRMHIPPYHASTDKLDFMFSNYGVPDPDEFNFRYSLKFERDFITPISAVKGPHQFWYPAQNPNTEGGASVTGLMQPVAAGNSQNPQPYTIDIANNRVILRFPFQYPFAGIPPDGAPVQWVFQTPPPGIVERQVYFIRNATTVAGVSSFQISASALGALFVFTAPQPGLVAPDWWAVGKNRSCLVMCDNTTIKIALCGGFEFLESSDGAAFGRRPTSGFRQFFIYNYDPISIGGSVGNYPAGIYYGSPDTAYPLVRREKAYQVELHVKMNSVDLTNVDSFGNGVGRFDGVSECFWNGSLADARSNRIFRHHPGIKVGWVRLQGYHGGVNETQCSLHFRASDFVLATGPNNYIGPKGTGVIPPPVQTLPAWLQGKPVGEWVPIPNSSITNLSLNYVNDPRIGLTFVPGPTGVQYPDNHYGLNTTSIAAHKTQGQYRYTFGGLAYDSGRYSGRSPSLMGASDQDWPENSIARFTPFLDVPAWDIAMYGGHASDYKHRSSGIALNAPGGDLWDTSHHPFGHPERTDDPRPTRNYDGSRRGAHIQQRFQYVGQRNWFVTVGCDLQYPSDTGVSGTCAVADLTAGAWVYDYPNETMPSFEPLKTSLVEHPRLKHEVTEDIWQIANDKIIVWRQATNAPWEIWWKNPDTNHHSVDNACAGINWQADYMLVAGVLQPGQSASTGKIFYWTMPLTGSTPVHTDLTLTGDAASVALIQSTAMANIKNFALEWIPDWGAFLFVTVGGTPSVYTLFKLTVSGSSLDVQPWVPAGTAPTGVATAMNNVHYVDYKGIKGIMVRVFDTALMQFIRTA